MLLFILKKQKFLLKDVKGNELNLLKFNKNNDLGWEKISLDKTSIIAYII